MVAYWCLDCQYYMYRRSGHNFLIVYACLGMEFPRRSINLFIAEQYTLLLSDTWNKVPVLLPTQSAKNKLVPFILLWRDKKEILHNVVSRSSCIVSMVEKRCKRLCDMNERNLHYYVFLKKIK